MTTIPTTTVLTCTPNIRRRDSQSLSHDDKLSDLSDDALATWGIEHSNDLDYRAELARRIALRFDDADQLIIFDDMTFNLKPLERSHVMHLRGFDRTLLPALWLSLGFRCGSQVLVYAPPNPVEMDAYLNLKTLIEQHLQRAITIRVLYEDVSGHLLDLIAIFEENPDRYTALCEAFAQRPANEYYPEYQMNMLKRHLNTIIQRPRRAFVFPYAMTEFHQRELQSYSDRLTLPDIPTNDKAQHNLFLRSKGFTALPQLLAVYPNGSIIDNYEQYTQTLKHIDPGCRANTPQNVEVFARAIIKAIDRLRYQYGLRAFVKLDSDGLSGIQCMTHSEHGIIYDSDLDFDDRVLHLRKHIALLVIDGQLPTSAVIEEFIEAHTYSGGISADHGVCGFILDGKFFPISINLCGTENAVFIEQWASPSPTHLHNSPADWQRMFQTYSTMTALEATEFSYKNGIYAGDLFIAKDGHHKQRDWNIRRSGRSSSESMIIFGMPNYSTSVVLPMTDFGLNEQLNNIEMFRIYTQICECLVNENGMYVFSTACGYCGKDEFNDSLKFNVITHLKCLLNTENHEESFQNLPSSEHRRKMIEFVRDIARQILSKQKIQ